VWGFDRDDIFREATHGKAILKTWGPGAGDLLSFGLLEEIFWKKRAQGSQKKGARKLRKKKGLSISDQYCTNVKK